MSRISQHFIPEGKTVCEYCGTSQEQIAVKSCLWRDVPDGDRSDLKPEPKTRIRACDAADAISARIAELKREREDALNIPAEPTGNLF